MPIKKGGKMRGQYGFTLIELIIIIAIMGTLTSVAIPAYQNYTQATANNSCLAEANAYARRVKSDIQLNKSPSDIPAPIARACNEVNNGDPVTTTATFTASTRAPGAATITCNLSAEVLCTKSIAMP